MLNSLITPPPQGSGTAENKQRQIALQWLCTKMNSTPKRLPKYIRGLLDEALFEGHPTSASIQGLMQELTKLCQALESD